MEVVRGVDDGKKYPKDRIRCNGEEDRIITVGGEFIAAEANKGMDLPPQG